MKGFVLMIFLLALQLIASAQTRVLVMDCRAYDPVYDHSVYRSGGSNATQIAQIIRRQGLSIRVEHTGINWLNQGNIQNVRNFGADLLIIHTSAFYDSFNPGSMDIYRNLSRFLQYFAPGYSGNILIYSRNFAISKQGLLQMILQSAPQLNGRIYFHDIDSFTDPYQANRFKNRVYNLL